jgi:hypothetical protein
MTEELDALRTRCKRQAAEIRDMQVASERRNAELAALRVIWCTGPCSTRWPDTDVVTQDIADEAARHFDRFATKALNQSAQFDARSATKLWFTMTWPRRRGWLRSLWVFAAETMRLGWRHSWFRMRWMVLTYHLWRKRR